jgi:hypothetical protein
MSVSVGNTALCLGQLLLPASYGVSEPGVRELKNRKDVCVWGGGGDRQWLNLVRHSGVEVLTQNQEHLE